MEMKFKTIGLVDAVGMRQSVLEVEPTDDDAAFDRGVIVQRAAEGFEQTAFPRVGITEKTGHFTMTP